MNEAPQTGTAYRVLARKYRPARFADLIGQEALVRTLTNAIRQKRLHHAYVLTGVRGVGKTTTARIIARALNCTGPDGKGEATPEPCGVCEHCRAIAEDRHVDVIEMDAASRTGIDDIRELIDGVRYKPMSARYKVYIVDEVHMLSKQAFNGLLKTLEEPPEHVIFVFATTEIRKVPITVLSRCQRFDLRRVDADVLMPHLARIAADENARLAPDALALLARAADGSVRDGLSLLDQAIGTFGGDGEVSAENVRTMLGLADRTQIFDLFEAAMGGKAAQALDLLSTAIRAGADPLVVVQDLLELVHWVTRVKLVPDVADDAAVPEAERVRGRAAAENLSMGALTRAWQLLLKAVGEARDAPNPGQAVEMALVRLCYAADLPPPADIVRQLQDGGAVAASAPRPSGSAASPSPRGGGRASASAAMAAEMRAEPAPQQAPRAAPQAMLDPRSFDEVVQLFLDKREAVLHANLLGSVHLVRFEPGRLELRLGDHTPRDLPNKVQKLLSEWTGRHWAVSVSRETGAPTLTEQAKSKEEERRSDARNHPLVRAVFEAFPQAEIVAVRDLAAEAAPELAETPEGAETLDPEDQNS